MTSTAPKLPGPVLEGEIRHTGLSQKDFASTIGVTAAYLSMLVSGSRAFTENICRKLGQHTRVKEADWLAMAQTEAATKTKAPRRESRKEAAGGGGGGAGVLGEFSLKLEIAEGRVQVTPSVWASSSRFAEGDSPPGSRLQDGQLYGDDNLDNGTLLLRPTNSVIIMTADGARQTVRTEQATLEAGALLLVETLESIVLPPHLCAQVEGLGEMIQEGLMVIPATLPPGYRGRVFLTIKHLGFTPWELSTLPVARLRFYRVG